MATDLTILARLPIEFTVKDGGASHAPMIVAQVGGLEARLVVDTGSDVHLLTEDLVDELGLAKVEGEEGTDPSGATMPSWSVPDFDLSLGGLTTTLSGIVAIPAPAAFVEKGIRGIVSPQLLHPSAWAVVDMAADELLLVEGDDEQLAACVQERSPALTVLTLDRDRAFSQIVVNASIEGFDEMPTLLDSGGKVTEYSVTAISGLQVGESGRVGGGLSGSMYTSGSVGPQTLLVGGRQIRVPDLRVRDQMHGPQGIVGMDVMRGTVMACAADMSRPVIWAIRDLGG